MTDLTIDRFNDYFVAVHNYSPYPWQTKLAQRTVQGDWPGAIDLPTGSGKTACIDIAVYALACQASMPVEQRTAPRRIFFCVNRRVIVDEACERAKRIANKIWGAERDGGNASGVLGEVATALRRLAGVSSHDGADAQDVAPPLDVLELRGGIFRDNRWARSITQPTIICTTIDQLGSRLLFRGYGVSTNAASIQAALIAYDSLILLDEAHISNPFLQTLGAVRRYLEPAKWSERHLGVKPAVVVPMTATPNDPMRQNGVYQLTKKDRDTESLRKRLSAPKPAELRPVNNIDKEAVKEAGVLANGNPAAVGVIVNRVATAKAIYQALLKARKKQKEEKRKAPPYPAIELVIGSMRPIDRDVQMERLRKLVGPVRPIVTKQTCFVVSTQCLEVGADYDFDVLITECASLDALRQRFGRLNRTGRDLNAKAVVLISKKDIKPEDKLDDAKPLDPIYGNALARTWNWLHDHATDGAIDFGIDAFNKRLAQHGDHGRILANLLAPSASLNAPVMLPAHLDFWCQNSPRPMPDPDIALFLHGERRGEPDVQVCWRADLVEDGLVSEKNWCDVIALLPPTSAECMSVPISRLRRWLANQTEECNKNDSDLLGVSSEPDMPNGERPRNKTTDETSIKGLLWRGVRDSAPLETLADLRPGDTLVLPVAAGGWDELGHLPRDPSSESPESNTALIDRAEDANAEIVDATVNSAASEQDCADIDVAEIAFQAARGRAALRLHPSLQKRLPTSDAIKELFDRAVDDEDSPKPREWINLLKAAAKSVPSEQSDFNQVLDDLADGNKGLVCERYPDGRGVVLQTRRRINRHDRHDSIRVECRGVGLQTRRRINRGLLSAIPALDDGDDAFSRTENKDSVTLDDHTAHVVNEVKRAIALLPIGDMADAFRLAAKLHDLGKADERFQAVLRQTGRTDVWLFTSIGDSALLAKSASMPLTQRERIDARKRADLPVSFRHEMLSVQLAQRSDVMSDIAADRDLALHLIAAHHGRARPFAPVVIDNDPPDVEIKSMRLTTAQRRACPSHRLDSGVAERFWTLTRRFGWWGLAYLEAVLRLADQRASAAEDTGKFDDTPSPQSAEVPA